MGDPFLAGSDALSNLRSGVVIVGVSARSEASHLLYDQAP